MKRMILLLQMMIMILFLPEYLLLLFLYFLLHSRRHWVGLCCSPVKVDHKKGGYNNFLKFRQIRKCDHRFHVDDTFKNQAQSYKTFFVLHSTGHEMSPLVNMSLVVRKLVFGVSDQVRNTNRSVQPQKMARGLKFRI